MVAHRQDEDEELENNRTLIGRIPVMLRSDHCYLKSMDLDDKVLLLPTSLGRRPLEQLSALKLTGPVLRLDRA